MEAVLAHEADSPFNNAAAYGESKLTALFVVEQVTPFPEVLEFPSRSVSALVSAASMDARDTPAAPRERAGLRAEGGRCDPQRGRAGAGPPGGRAGAVNGTRYTGPYGTRTFAQRGMVVTQDSRHRRQPPHLGCNGHCG